MREVALPDYRSVPGNLRAWCLHRAEGDIVHVEMLTLWQDEAAIRRRTGIRSAERVGANLQEALQYPSLNVRGMAAASVMTLPAARR